MALVGRVGGCLIACPLCGGPISKDRLEGLMIIRGREYVDEEEYLDEVGQYRLDALKEGREEEKEED
jgi:hypothetical protein